MKNRNEQIKKLEIILDNIVKNPELHIKWLNTLSYLEHCGSRKIHKTHFGPYLNVSVLSHASEEARHAFLFKKFIKKVNPQIDLDSINYTYQSMLLGFSAYKYFQSIDIFVRDEISKEYSKNDKNFFCYLFTTLLIEERASIVFAVYQERLKTSNQNFTIEGIIEEEEKHLKEVYSLLEKHLKNYTEYIEKYFNKESELFEKFLDKLNNFFDKKKEL